MRPFSEWIPERKSPWKQYSNNPRLSNSSPVVCCTEENICPRWKFVFDSRYFHRQDDRIDHDQGENGIFERRWGDEPPDFQLNFFRWDITFDRFGFQREFDAFPLEKKQSERISWTTDWDHFRSSVCSWQDSNQRPSASADRLIGFIRCRQVLLQGHFSSLSIGVSHLILVQFTIAILLFSFVLKRDDDETDEDVHHEKRDDLWRGKTRENFLFDENSTIVTMMNAMKNGATNGR